MSSKTNLRAAIRERNLAARAMPVFEDQSDESSTLNTTGKSEPHSTLSTTQNITPGNAQHSAQHTEQFMTQTSEHTLTEDSTTPVPFEDTSLRDATNTSTQNIAQHETQTTEQNIAQSSAQEATLEPGQGIVNFVREIAGDVGKQRVEETHTRRTYLIENDLVERLEAEARRRPRGWPTKLINGLLRAYFEEQDRIATDK
ncbi:hypothetical protein [Alicyclobacillus macrosporangiidus]|uniref:Uncharacterized protein n=1 Tax=Alicyclobacillus macrosporangiidus TaxID=392015 RepID=A0A1I7L2J8_9BACL|nr:hypothetical protein [Alicyclobacillus macrosporangiidus]SFV03950.1 hypothetical protein SAMN05421543_12364 [Alicyclobacillus macrosporangiidus]